MIVLRLPDRFARVSDAENIRIDGLAKWDVRGS
jgi:hypothetical protein